MKTISAISLGVVGLIAGIGLQSLRVSNLEHRRSQELATLRLSVQQSEDQKAKAIAQRDQWKTEADRLRQQAEEVHRLRSEISQLTREVAENRTKLQQMPSVAKATERVAVAVDVPEKIKGKEPVLSLSEAPPPVQTTLLRELGAIPANGSIGIITDKNGEITGYAFKGQTADGRSAYARVATDGTVLQKSIEIPANTVPAQVQTPVAQLFGDVAISGVREIREGNNLRYELSAKNQNAGLQMTVREDGTVLGYSARFQQGDKEQPGQKPVK